MAISQATQAQVNNIVGWVSLGALALAFVLNCVYFYQVNKAGVKGPGFGWAAAAFSFFVVYIAAVGAQHFITNRTGALPVSYQMAKKYGPYAQ